MSEKELQSISATTGQFPALSLAARAAGGNATPDSGKQLPVSGLSKGDLGALVGKLNAASQSVGRELRFEVNLGSRRAVIQVLDSETGELIREIPPEKARLYLDDGGDFALRLIDASA